MLLHLQCMCDLTRFSVLKFGRPVYLKLIQGLKFSQYTVRLYKTHIVVHFDAFTESDM